MIALLLCLATVMAAVGAGAQTASEAGVKAVEGPGKLDYSPDPPGRLRRLSPSFIADALGLPPAPGANVYGGQPAPTLPSELTRLAAPRGNIVKTPTYGCVNGHQTDDPLSPPCIAQFSGDNGGATYQGVTGNEVRILVTVDVHADIQGPSRHESWGTYYDLGTPPSADETANMPWVQRARLLQDYFNRHYQTYGRRVHFFVYSQNQGGDEAYRNDALQNVLVVRPFAVLIAPGLNTVPRSYAEELARLGVPSFDLNGEYDSAYFARYPGLLWSYRPAAPESAGLFGSYLCQKVLHQPVVASGNPGDAGHTRKLGLLKITDQPRFDAFVDLVRRDVQRCGGSFADVEQYREPLDCGAHVEGESTGGTGTDDSAAMAAFKAHGVTTIIWPACIGLRMARSAEAIGYFPEWVLWGAGDLDNALFADVSAWPAAEWDRHAFLVTPSIPFRPDPQTLCYRAQLQEDPKPPELDIGFAGCEYYEGLRQLFSAIQLAGPQLTPAAIDRGVRAFVSPPSNPQTPRCEYPAGDYSCIKDAEVQWWDSGGSHSVYLRQAPAVGEGGCWRSMEDGRRYGPGSWSSGNLDAQLRPTDPCSLRGVHAFPT